MGDSPKGQFCVNDGNFNAQNKPLYVMLVFYKDMEIIPIDKQIDKYFLIEMVDDAFIKV